MISEPFVYVALFEDPPTFATAGTEPWRNGYARVQVPKDSSTWGWSRRGKGSVVTNKLRITFPNPTGAGWGEPAWFGLFTAPVGGDLLMWGKRGTPFRTDTGKAPLFEPGEIAITLDPA